MTSLNGKHKAQNHRQALEIRPMLPEQRELTVTKEQITLLMLEAHKKSSNSAEEIMALREIAKIHGMYALTPTTVTIGQINIEGNQKKLQGLSDEKLLELAGMHPKLFERPEEADTIEAEFEEVENE